MPPQLAFGNNTYESNPIISVILAGGRKWYLIIKNSINAKYVYKKSLNVWNKMFCSARCYFDFWKLIFVLLGF
jgi:hypothetical protein